MLPRGFQWQRQSSSWGTASWLVANGQPVGIVSTLDEICYVSHPSSAGFGWTTERAASPDDAVAALERWATANARLPWMSPRAPGWAVSG